jgi:hypothetical protein
MALTKVLRSPDIRFGRREADIIGTSKNGRRGIA